MKRTLVTLCVVLVLSLGPLATTASSEPSRSFLGLWQGIDPRDGSGVLYSLADNDRDGVIEIIGRETFFTGCGGDGVVNGTGVVGRGGLLVAEVVLKCRPGPELPATATFQLIPRDDVLILVAPAPAAPPITLHRVSQR
jgi:hypothetical protein